MRTIFTAEVFFSAFCNTL
uniref:Uncharacterized protein n=1 Tax=Rhizophora mucronata TaxID=61149 RepID=A0A2P2MS02_RHIMU